MPAPGDRRSPFARLRPAAFGTDPAGERLARIRRSPQYADGQFRNPVPTRTMLPGSAAPPPVPYRCTGPPTRTGGDRPRPGCG